MKNINKHSPVVLVVLDGWGISLTDKGNAINLAKTPVMDALERNYPMSSLQAAGVSVGLPWGEPGNSEVGHTSLGSGFIRYQNLPRITMEVQNGEFFINKSLLKTFKHVRDNKSSLHLMGLLSDGGVHSSTDHLFALLDMAKRQKVKRVFIHAFTDGRDVAPRSFKEYLGELKKAMRKYHVGKLASVAGRFFALDRNNNWDRVQKAYDVICGSGDNGVVDPMKAVKAAYNDDKSDEYVEPRYIAKRGKPIGPVVDNDAVIFFDFRPDRAREITGAFTIPGFNKFPVREFKNLQFTTMTKYDDDLPVEVVYPDVPIEVPLSRVISEERLSQLHIAETEKYAHVTYFFNGGKEKPYAAEDHVLIPSPAVTDYSQRPDMSARLIADRVEKEVRTGGRDFILINFANPDMVGHTGNLGAAITAVETVDEVLGRVIDAVLEAGGSIIVTADHGNAEEMLNLKTGEVETSHTTNSVPFLVVDNRYKKRNSDGDILQAKSAPVGLLADVAPTIADLLGIQKSPDMTGVSLVKHLV